MIIPEVGPPGNGLDYSSGKDANRMAEFFDPEMPADKIMGVVAETLRQHPKANRSGHPILSFAGINMDEALAAQSIEEPLAPIRFLAEAGGWVLLMGVDHTVNTSIHYAEKLAKRKQFVRWALTPTGIRECPGFPGCSDGFGALEPHLEGVTRQNQIGEALVQAVPLPEMITLIRQLIEEDPLSLLCARSNCQRCHENRP
jgi:aminoglycoside 3-N-acetyltransferase